MDEVETLTRVHDAAVKLRKLELAVIEARDELARELTAARDEGALSMQSLANAAGYQRMQIYRLIEHAAGNWNYGRSPNGTVKR